MTDFAEFFKTSSLALVLPKENDDDVNRYIAMHSGERENVERRPFYRQLDFWAFSITTALAMELSPREGKVGSWGKTFIYTSQGILDNNLGSLLAVIAVAKLGHESPGIHEPKKIVDLANRLAGAGCPKVLKEISESGLRTTPLECTLEFAARLQNHVQANE